MIAQLLATIAAAVASLVEPFVGTNGSPWPPERWGTPFIDGNGICDIQGGYGRQVSASSQAFGVVAITPAVAVPPDSVATGIVRWDSVGVDFYTYAALRADFLDSYSVEFVPLAGRVNLKRYISGSPTIELDTTSFSFAAATDYRWEIRVVGSQIEARVWPATGSRPTGPTLSGVDSTHTGGNLQLYHVGGGTPTARTARWADVQVRRASA